MKILVKRKSELITKIVLNHIVKYITLKAYLSLDRKRLKEWDKYFSELIKSKRKISTKQIIMSGFNNIVVYEYDEEFIICINPVIKVPYFDNIKLESLCNLIDKGNLEMHPYPIFTKWFNYFVDNFRRLYSMYEMGII